MTFRHRHSYLLWISRFIPPVYHVASLGWLRQSSSRLIPAVCVRLQGPRSMRSCRRAIRWCLPRAKQAAGMNLCMSDIRKQIRRQILGDLIAEGKTGREARAIPHANRKQHREVRSYLNGKIEYDAMTGQTETDRGRRQQNSPASSPRG